MCDNLQIVAGHGKLKLSEISGTMVAAQTEESWDFVKEERW